MGNNVASMLIESFRKSKTDTTLVSKTSSTPPVFSPFQDIPGVARAWVMFEGQLDFSVSNECRILNSTNVEAVTSKAVGEYDVRFVDKTFTNGNYIITGSVTSNTTNPISAANTFYVKSSGSGLGSFPPSTHTVRIQTLYVPISTGTGESTRPAFANRVQLMFYK